MRSQRLRYGPIAWATAALAAAAVTLTPTVATSSDQGPAPAAAPVAGAQAAATGTRVKARIVAINDFHGHLEPKGLSISARTATSKGAGHVPAGGAAYLAAKVKALKKQNPNTVVVSAGDMIGASPMVSGYFHDEPSIEVMNKIVDVGAVGNHEFDEGSAELTRLIEGGCHPQDGCRGGHRYQGMKFDLLGANVVVRRTGQPFLPPTVIKNVGGAKIGFIGVTTIDTPRLLIPEGITSIAFLDPVATIRRYAPQLRAQGADAIVVVIHEGAAQNRGEAGRTSGINACKNIMGPVVDITREVQGQVDAVVSGHTHRAYNCRVGDTLLTEAATYGRLVTKIDLNIDTAGDRVVSATARNEIVDHKRRPDRAVATIVARYRKIIAPKANAKVGVLRRAADRDPSRSGESRLGDLIADAQLRATKKREDGGAQLAIVQRGVLRGDLPRGRVTAEDVYLAQPFGVRLVTKTFTGSQLDDALEEQFCNDSATTNDRRVPLNVSHTFRYRYDPEKSCGNRIRMRDTLLNGTPITPTGRYRVTMNAFLATGGDGLTGFSGGSERSLGITDQQALTRYLKARSKDGAITPPRRLRVRPL